MSGKRKKYKKYSQAYKSKKGFDSVNKGIDVSTLKDRKKFKIDKHVVPLKNIVVENERAFNKSNNNSGDENVGVSSINVLSNSSKGGLNHKRKVVSSKYNASVKNRNKFYKRKAMKKNIYSKHNKYSKSSFKKHTFDKIKDIPKLLLQKSKSKLIAVVMVVIMLFSIVQIFVGMSSSITTSTTEVMNTTYLSDQAILVAINYSYSTKELNLENEVNRIEENYQEYDEYKIVKNEEIGHDVHVLLSYFSSKYGEVEKLIDVENEIQELFNEVYEVKYTESVEIRTREINNEVTNDEGEISTVVETEEYEYKILTLTINKSSLDKIVRKRLESHPDNLKYYETLLSTKGNMEGLFAGVGVIGSVDGVSSVYSYDVSDGKFPAPDPNHIAALNGGYAGQCTWYVYNRFSQLGMPIKNAPMGNGGEWAIYAQNYGYTVTREARPGLAMSIPPGVAGSSTLYGHIAFVEKVNEDGSILVSEMNVFGEFIISTRTISKSEAAKSYYIDFGL